MKRGPKPTPASERMAGKYKEMPSGCWEWFAGADKNGYGRIGKMGGGTLLAHRVSYAMRFGEPPPHLHVCHRCDNPKCINPDHLFLGTDLDNQNDSKNKCRSSSIRSEYKGPGHPCARLTIDQCKAIVADFETGTYTKRALGEKYGISGNHAGKIIRGDHWSKLA